MGDLPSFKKPPVVETVIGVQFDPLSSFRNAHMGRFWGTLGSGWSEVDEQPLLAAQFEEFPTTWAVMGAQLMLPQGPAQRLCIHNPEAKRMLQVQNGRLHLNWLGGGDYPRYKVVKPEFDELVSKFQSFLAEHQLGELVPNQWEITYVNHVPAGTLWGSPADWGTVFPGLGSATPEASMVVPDAFKANLRYEIPPHRGRLHIEVDHARSKTTNKDRIVVKLTARGPIRSEDGLSLDAGLDLGHECIVRTFAEVSSKEAHDYWERER